MVDWISHRGNGGSAPENTLPAFEEARSFADGIELDVQLARCGTPVVTHDEDLVRIYGVERGVEELTAAELGALRPIIEVPGDPAAAFVPTLRQALDVIPTDRLLNVEIKAPEVAWRTPTRAVAEVLDELGRDPLVSCFNPLELVRLGLRRRRTRLALLFDPSSSFVLRTALSAPVLSLLEFEALHPNWKLVSPALVERAHERGWKVNVWTVNDLDRARWLADQGVDALITDRVVELRTELEG